MPSFGITRTRTGGQWTPEVPLVELKYELSRRKHREEERSQIQLMQDVLKIALVSIEALNERFGPFLHLRGWSRHATSDMSRYERSLRAIHYRYFRRSLSSPIMELGWIVIGSAFMWHVQCKFLGGPPMESPPPASSSTIRPPPRGNRAKTSEGRGGGGGGGGGRGGGGGGMGMGTGTGFPFNLADVVRLFGSR